MKRASKDSERKGPRKVGLLTPYTGGNLGDAAIQEAAICNVRRFWPGAEVCGFTLDPEASARRHGIPCYPIMGPSPRHYAPVSWPRAAGPASGTGGASGAIAHRTSLAVRKAVRRIPFLAGVLRRSYHATQRISRKGAGLLFETRHVIASYRRVRQLDLVIVSGGGQLDDYWGGPWGHPYALLKWGLLAWAARKPYVFLSVGTCALRSTLSTLFIRGALKLAVYRSYRDQGSKDLVNRLGFTRSDPVFPDLAFSYSVPSNGNRRKSVSERLVIGVSPIAYLHPHLWPMSNASVHDAYMKELAVFIASLVRQGHRVVLLPTATSDAVVIKELIHILHVDHGLGQDSAITGPPVSGLDDLFFHLRRVDCMVASRLHGVILSHLAGKPVLAVSYDRKVAAYMTDMAQPEFCLDIHTVTAVSLEKTLHQLLANSERSGAAISERASEFRRLLENQYDAAFSAIEETQSGGRRQRHP